ncbi:MAG: caspase family protein [Pseudomonadota bacterium]
MKLLAHVFLWFGIFLACTPGLSADKIKKPGSPALQEPLSRVALIIGNANYRDSSKLKNPLNDARDMCTALKQLNFDVICKLDITTKRDFKNAIYEFTEKIDSRTIALFYFAGHGIEADRINYLLPTQAALKTKSDIDDEAVPVNYIVSELNARRAMLNIVLLDACRDNPLPAPIRGYTQTVGFAHQDVLPDNGVVLLSTKPGKVALDGLGDNSVFTRNILRSISLPKLSINDFVLKTMAGTSKEARAMGLEQQPELRQTFNEKLCLAGCDDERGGTASREAQETQLKLKQQELEQLQATISAAKAEQREVEAQKSDMLRKQGEIEKIKAGLVSSQAEQAALEQQKLVLQRQKMEIDAQKEELLRKQTDIEKIRRSLADSQSEQQNLEFQKHALRQKQQEIDAQRNSLAQNQKEVEQIKSSLAGSREEQATLENQRKDLLKKQKEVEGLKQDIASASNKLQEMQDAKKRLLERQDELDRLHKLLAAQELEIKAKEAKIQSELNNPKNKRTNDPVIIPSF